MRFILALTLFFAVAATTGCTTGGGPNLDGMSFTERPLSGKVIWNELITEDLDGARRFYAGMFGWTFEDAQGATDGEYLVARLGEVYVAGLLAIEGHEDGHKISRWLPYVSVGRVDAALQRGLGAGASVAAAARDVPLGRVAAIIDPQGAVVGLAASRIGDPDDATTRAGPGRVVWHEMLARDAVDAAAFYRLIGGYDVETVNRRGGQYTLLLQNGVRRAGIMERPNDDVKPVWLTHFGVEDPAKAAARAESLGGSIILAPTPELRDGTTAVVTDPGGAVLVLSRI